MILDRLPDVKDSDEDIINYALSRGLLRSPVTFISLAGAVLPEQPDMARIQVHRGKAKVTRCI